MNVRTSEGRAELDARVRAALTPDPSDIHALASKAGATLHQVRASLRRLRKAGLASRTGNTRATRYAATAEAA